MKQALIGIAFFAALFPNSFALAETDWLQVDAALGKKATVIGAVHKYGFPRGDLHVKLENVDIKPGLALGGWVAFEPAGDAAMMMGDLVLTENEVGPVMKSLLAGGVQVTALHNHLFRATPATFYMHVGGHGDPAQLAKTLREALAQTKTPFDASAASPAADQKIGFDVGQVEQILGFQGKNNGGVFQFSVPKAERISAGGRALSPAMGIANAINFQPTDDGRAAISGDFVATAREVQPLLKALQSNGIEVTALHNHMLDDEPRLFFVHFWADDEAAKLARGVRAGLDAVHAAPAS
ncbi:DUF1259 domain-containing protein [Methylocystis heyeri]|uniref:DUF1259 domain-containing protein n=1 Tax=Methylocystis heyeri TaxID=391905 RepID=A0A6B8KC48_9HYPH|nr:DUF1259 domain-containing protein [Methylocystis heyeri]QGM44641.1 DUF1259 domain-containing protein [Methylocystis heyeri]